METKVCNTCGEELPATEKYFYRRKDTNDGFRNDCKKCMIKNAYKRHWENREQILESKKKHYKENWEKERSLQKKYRQENADKIRDINKRYQKENPLKTSKWYKKYYETHREESLKRKKKYKMQNKDKVVIFSQNRRARLRQLPATLTAEEWCYIKQHFNYGCAYCGRKLTLTQDHFIPITKGGWYTKENIVPACGSCNSSKLNHDFYEWYPNYKHYSKEREQKIIKYMNDQKNIY